MSYKTGFVYIYGGISGGEGLYKIGYSKDPVARAKSLVNGPFQCKMIMTLYSDNAMFLKKELHKYWDSKRLNGEWFKLTLNDIQDVAKISFKLSSHRFLPKKEAPPIKPIKPIKKPIRFINRLKVKKEEQERAAQIINLHNEGLDISNIQIRIWGYRGGRRNRERREEIRKTLTDAVPFYRPT